LIQNRNLCITKHDTLVGSLFDFIVCDSIVMMFIYFRLNVWLCLSVVLVHSCYWLYCTCDLDKR